MRGILGVCGVVDAVAPNRALDAIAHRVPDDWGLFVDEEAGVRLGYRRLAIID